MHLDGTPHNLEESDFESLAFWTEGFSGSDISVCVSLLHTWRCFVFYAINFSPSCLLFYKYCEASQLEITNHSDSAPYIVFLNLAV